MVKSRPFKVTTPEAASCLLCCDYFVQSHHLIFHNTCAWAWARVHLVILLLAEVTAACASRLSNMLTLAHFGSLAFVKSLPRNPAPSQGLRQNLKHSLKWDLLNNNGHLKSLHSGGGSFKRVNNNNNNNNNNAPTTAIHTVRKRVALVHFLISI